MYKEAPTKEELEKMAEDLGHPRQLVATRGKYFKESGLDLETDSAKKIIAALVAQPRLLKRPLLVSQAGSIAGFSERAYEDYFRGLEQ